MPASESEQACFDSIMKLDCADINTSSPEIMFNNIEDCAGIDPTKSKEWAKDPQKGAKLMAKMMRCTKNEPRHGNHLQPFYISIQFLSS